jgi:hypothetical protein
MKLGHLCVGGHRLASGILSFMENPTSNEGKGNHPKGPNFAVVVALAGVTLILLLIAAVIFLSARGKKDLPLNHKHTLAKSLMPLTGDSAHRFEVQLQTL